ncbi:hypothetical protein, partial [Roseiflexus sp.]|uniref:hypothetical protein n=1 Tax=Roseiflexus sp. TaxID=2562120 RepID=UPI00398AF19C
MSVGFRTRIGTVAPAATVEPRRRTHRSVRWGCTGGNRRTASPHPSVSSVGVHRRQPSNRVAASIGQFGG